MKAKEQIKKIMKDFSYRAIVIAVFSLVINAAFIAYNLYIGISFGDAFALGISIYYFLLFCVMISSLIVEFKLAGKGSAEQSKIRMKNYRISSILIFLIDFCLIAPIILMVTQPKDVAFGIIPAIAMAAYCVYKIVFAIINYLKSKKSQNLTTILLKEINIIGGIVSILMLQHTLIMVNGGMNKTMQRLSLITSIVFLLVIIVFSIVSFVANKKQYVTKSDKQ